MNAKYWSVINNNVFLSNESHYYSPLVLVHYTLANIMLILSTNMRELLNVL